MVIGIHEVIFCPVFPCTMIPWTTYLIIECFKSFLAFSSAAKILSVPSVPIESSKRTPGDYPQDRPGNTIMYPRQGTMSNIPT